MTSRAVKAHMNENYHELLFRYAAGTLPPAQHLIVCTHLSLSPKGYALASAYEAMGACLMEHDNTLSDPCSEILTALLEKVESFETEGSNAPLGDEIDPSTSRPGQPRASDPEGPDSWHEKSDTHPLAVTLGVPVPDILCHGLSESCSHLRWKTLLPGLQTLPLTINKAFENDKIQFLKSGPGVKAPHHRHAGYEITLILDGAFHDETGSYHMGDLIITDEQVPHQPTACPEKGCVCMVVSSAPIKLTGIKSLLNPFIRD